MIVFLATTFDLDDLRASNHLQFVPVVQTIRLICNMTFSSQVMTLTWLRLKVDLAKVDLGKVKF